MLRSCGMTLRALLASTCVLAFPLILQSQTMELARVQAAMRPCVKPRTKTTAWLCTANFNRCGSRRPKLDN